MNTQLGFGDFLDPVVVIVTYNSATHLAEALRSVTEFDVVVVDNGSSDDSVAVARQFSNVHCVALNRNRGFAYACNRGIERAGGRDVLLMNPDVVAGATQIRQLSRLLHMSETGILLPRLTYPDGESQETLRTMPSVLDLVRRRGAPTSTSISTTFNRWNLFEVDWGIGAAMLVSADALRGLGGLNESFFLYFEDVDLCARAWRAGFAVRATDQVVFTHAYGRASRSTLALWRRPVRLHWAAFLRYLRNYPRLALRLNARSVFAGDRRWPVPTQVSVLGPGVRRAEARSVE